MELVGRYSNPDEWEHLGDITLALAEPADGGTIGVIDVAHSCVRPWPVTDRLGEQAVRELLRDRRSGAMQRVLAERYGISLSSVKRLLRQQDTR